MPVHENPKMLFVLYITGFRGRRRQNSEAGEDNITIECYNEKKRYRPFRDYYTRESSDRNCFWILKTIYILQPFQHLFSMLIFIISGASQMILKSFPKPPELKIRPPNRQGLGFRTGTGKHCRNEKYSVTGQQPPE